MSTAIIVVLVLMLGAYLAFTYRYARFSPWRSTWQGVTLLSQKITLVLIVGFFIADTAIPGDWPGRNMLLIGLLTLFTIEAWASLWGLVHVQRKNAPVPRRQGTGYVPPEDIENTDPRRSS